MPRPRSFRTQAIILKRRDFGEADRLLTLVTPDYGKIDVIAKGARDPKSPFGASLDFCRIVKLV